MSSRKDRKEIEEIELICSAYWRGEGMASVRQNLLPLLSRIQRTGITQSNAHAHAYVMATHVIADAIRESNGNRRHALALLRLTAAAARDVLHSQNAFAHAQMGMAQTYEDLDDYKGAQRALDIAQAAVYDLDGTEAIRLTVRRAELIASHGGKLEADRIYTSDVPRLVTAASTYSPLQASTRAIAHGGLLRSIGQFDRAHEAYAAAEEGLHLHHLVRHQHVVGSGLLSAALMDLTEARQALVDAERLAFRFGLPAGKTATLRQQIALLEEIK